MKSDHEDRVNFYEDKISVLEKRLVQQRRKLKAEIKEKVRQTQARMEAKMQNELDTTTKRTMEHNRRMAAELRLQSKRTDEMLTENKLLKEERRSLKAEVEILRDAQDAELRKLKLYEKLVKELKESARSAAVENTFACVPAEERSGLEIVPPPPDVREVKKRIPHQPCGSKRKQQRHSRHPWGSG